MVNKLFAKFPLQLFVLAGMIALPILFAQYMIYREVSEDAPVVVEVENTPTPVITVEPTASPSATTVPTVVRRATSTPTPTESEEN